MTIIESSEITPENVYLNRREFIRGLIAGGLALATQPLMAGDSDNEVLTPYKSITQYNNFYEFTTNKEMVHIIAREFKSSPWQLKIEGEVEKPLTLDMDALKAIAPEEERIYRLRCVEGWSMVIPWLGIPLHKLINATKPLSSAKYVEFVSVMRPEEMIGQRQSTLPWPYTEALRIDEAVHPLTLLVTGLYGKPLPNQNGAPIRLAVPWKYGYKSIKSIQTIRLTEKKPTTSWSRAVPSEYGFYGNVNPDVPHPRWSQKREIRIGELRKRRTQLFNGYADQVASLYAGQDLKALF